MKVKKTRKWIKSTIGFILLGLATVPIAVSIADDDKVKHKGKPKAFDPTESVSGMSQGDWGAAWWQWALSIPADRNPITDPDGSFCSFLSSILNVPKQKMAPTGIAPMQPNVGNALAVLLIPLTRPVWS